MSKLSRAEVEMSGRAWCALRALSSRWQRLRLRLLEHEETCYGGCFNRVRGIEEVKNDDLASEVKELRRDVNALLSKLGSRSSRPVQEPHRDPEDGGQSAAGVPSQHPGDYAAHENPDAPSDDLNMLQLQAPITTVHALTAGISSPPSTPSTLAGSAFRTSSINAASPRAQVFDDMVSRGIVGEAKARQLFHMYVCQGLGPSITNS